MSPRNTAQTIFYDLESTGLNYFYEHIIEIGAVSEDGTRFQTFVKPPINIPKKITELTGINDEMVKYAPDIKTAINQFILFICNMSRNKSIYLVAHNGNNFDHPFIKRYFKEFNINIPNITYVDTIPISKYISPERFSHSLKNICKYYGVNQENAHRADDDARCLREIYNYMLFEYIAKFGINNIIQIHRVSHL